ncbi:MAG: hypothetical protein ABI288_08590 [Ginsengibacter sp.]
MIEINNCYIPSLSENLTISSFDDCSYLVCIDNDEPVKLKITHTTKVLIEQFDGKKNIEEITKEFNKISGSNLSVGTINKIINDQLVGFGVLKNDLKGKLRIKDNYLKLRIAIFPRKMVRQMVSPFLFLFHKSTFKYIFFVCTVFLAISFLYTLNFQLVYTNISIKFLIWFFGVNILSVIFHELGHAGACEKFGAKTGPIGLGFYLFTPVFFTDVTDAWRLKKNERLIIDLAGIYMQIIFCSILVCIYFFSKNEFYLHTAFLISITLIFTLNPFVRYDGYWAVTDLLNVPNLRESSNNILSGFFRRIFRKDSTWILSRRNVFLLIYSITSNIFIAYFIIVLVVYSRNPILFFPVDVFNFVTRLVTEFQHVTFDWIKLNLSNFILPLIFYAFLFKAIKKYIHFFKFSKI